MPDAKPTTPISIFCAAAPSDMALLAQWETHLLPLQQRGQITVWSELHLAPGASRMEQVALHLDQSQVIVFLLSAAFFASDECMALVERARNGSTRVISLLVRPVDWQTSQLGNLACLPADGSFVTQWPDPDDALHTCVHELRRLLGLAASVPPQGSKGTSTVAQQNRERMLRRLHRSYTELMSQTLQGAVWLELGLAERPDAVQNAMQVLLRIKGSAEQPLPPGTSITQAYDEAEHELLILGEPGAGKSTLLLDLAKHLVERAETDETHPLPVILPLSTWAQTRGSLEDWIAEQVSQIYDVPRKVSTVWVQEGNVLPLLDGLDEMEEAARPACITAINTYHRDHLAPLVVCSRTTEYEAATSRHRLALQGAVGVQPLLHEAVDASLKEMGKSLAALRSTLKKNAALHDLATTPLMLNILILTYQGTSLRALSNKQEGLLQQVWDDYMQRMVQRKGNSERYPLSRTRAWLSYLARHMRDHNQTVFYLEHLQPDWLPIHQQRTYAWQAIRLPAIVIGVLVITLVYLFFTGNNDLPYLIQVGVLGGLLAGLWHGSVSENGHQGEHLSVWGKRLVISACVGLISGLSFRLPSSHHLPSHWQTDGLSYGVAIGLGSLLLQSLLTRSSRCGTSPENSSTRRWKQVARFWSATRGPHALLVAVITGPSVGLSIGSSYGLSYGLGYGLVFGLGYGLSYGLISLVLGAQMGDIHLTERLRWTSRNVFNSRHVRITVLLTCTSMIFVGLGNWLSYGLSIGLIYGLSIGLIFGLSYWFLFGLWSGIAQERIEDRDRRVANQGIHRSLRNSVMIGMISGAIIGMCGILSSRLILGLNYGLRHGLRVGLNYGLNTGLSVGLVMGITGALLICTLIGGLAVWRHYVIRLLLWRSRAFPGLASRFLEDATARCLLRRVGGGYSFAHRLLLDYMADTAPQSTAQASARVEATPSPPA